MNMRAGRLLAMLLLLSIALIGCDRQEAAWEEAREVDTVAAYQEFLESHPDAPQASTAERRIDELQRAVDWEEARQADTAEAYERFIAEHPEGEQADQARSRLAEMERDEQWAQLRETDDIEALRGFAERHPDTAEAAEARTRVSMLEDAAREAQAREQARIEAEERRRAEEEARLTHRVQLATLRTERAARDGAQVLQRQLADVLEGQAIEVQQVGDFHVLRTERMEEQDARAMCRRIRAQDGDCIVVPG